MADKSGKSIQSSGTNSTLVGCSGGAAAADMSGKSLASTLFKNGASGTSTLTAQQRQQPFKSQTSQMSFYNPDPGIRFIYDLPFGIRKSLCDLLDADGSWRQLGGQFMNHNDTQLTLISHALYRGASPTNDLLTKWEAKNPKVTTLFRYLAAMNHQRAMRILKPFVDERLQAMCIDSREDELDEALDFKIAAARYSGFNPIDDKNLEKYGAVGGVPMGSYRGSPHAPSRRPSEDSNIPIHIAGPSGSDITNAKTPITPMLEEGNEPWNDTIAYEKAKLHANPNQFGLNFINDLNSDRRQTFDPNQAHASGISPEIRVQPVDQQLQRQHGMQDETKSGTQFSMSSTVQGLDEELKVPYKELSIATGEFADENILGSGGFGVVYRGEWKGTQVAIKKLKNCDHLDQALTELRVLNRYRIDNILPLYAVSLDGPEACLLYQYMPNGSLEDRLLCKGQSKPLSWNQRALIGEGVARALNYLHTLRGQALVHGDVKSANVLLDAQMEPKLGDFGLARQVLGPALYTHCTVSSVHGTSVYLPPEYLRQKKLSPAVDVYSYGIVLLEMATGKRPYDGRQLLKDWVDDLIKDLSKKAAADGFSSWEELPPNDLKNIKDKRLQLDTDTDSQWFENLLKLGRDCSSRVKRTRPTMCAILEYYSQCKTRDRIRRLSANSDSPGPGTSPGGVHELRSPLELQLYYDIRKAGGAPESTVCPTIGSLTGNTQMEDPMAGLTPEPTDENQFSPNLMQKTPQSSPENQANNNAQQDQRHPQSPISPAPQNKSSSTDDCCNTTTESSSDENTAADSRKNSISNEKQAQSNDINSKDQSFNEIKDAQHEISQIVPTVIGDIPLGAQNPLNNNTSSRRSSNEPERSIASTRSNSNNNINEEVGSAEENNGPTGITQGNTSAGPSTSAAAAAVGLIPLITELGIKPQ